MEKVHTWRMNNLSISKSDDSVTNSVPNAWRLASQIHIRPHFDRYSRGRSRLCALNFLPHDTWRQLLDQLTAGAPYLDEVVLSSADHNPRVVPVEGEVADTVGVATVHEQHLWWAIFGILGRLLLSSAADVPEDSTTIVGRRTKDGALGWVPVDFCDGVCVALE